MSVPIQILLKNYIAIINTLLKIRTSVLYIFLKGALKMQEMLFQNFSLVQVPRSPSLSHFKTSTLEYLNLQYAMKKSAEGILHSLLHTQIK